MQTPRDNNRIPTLMGVLYSDKTTLVPISLSGNTVRVNQVNTLGSAYTGSVSPRDENRVTVLMGVSSVDGTTPVPVFVDSDGKILID